MCLLFRSVVGQGGPRPNLATYSAVPFMSDSRAEPVGECGRTSLARFKVLSAGWRYRSGRWTSKFPPTQPVCSRPGRGPNALHERPNKILLKARPRDVISGLQFSLREAAHVCKSALEGPRERRPIPSCSRSWKYNRSSAQRPFAFGWRGENSGHSTGKGIGLGVILPISLWSLVWLWGKICCWRGFSLVEEMRGRAAGRGCWGSSPAHGMPNTRSLPPLPFCTKVAIAMGRDAVPGINGR